MHRKVTYGVTGLIDWSAIIHAGNARLIVHFCGGAITKYGVTPAEFTTSDPVTQRIIEDSAYFRSGRIRTLRSSGSAPSKPAKATQTAQPAVEPRIIEVSCLQDAIDYMREHYDIPSVKIRTVETLTPVAAQYGITFNIPETK